MRRCLTRCNTVVRRRPVGVRCGAGAVGRARVGNARYRNVFVRIRGIGGGLARNAHLHSISGRAGLGPKVTMMVAWGFFFLAVVAGVLHLLALTSALTTSAPSINEGSAKLFAKAEQILFVIGLLLAVI